MEGHKTWEGRQLATAAEEEKSGTMAIAVSARPATTVIAAVQSKSVVEATEAAT